MKNLLHLEQSKRTMQQDKQLILEPLLQENGINRRSLLPFWMKVFIWLFMFAGVLSIICLVAGIAGASMEMSLYGLESNEPLTMTGMIILLLFILKGAVGFGLWFEKDWAVLLGITDAIMGIGICLYLTVSSTFLHNTSGSINNFRLELVALIPYLIRLWKIRSAWQRHEF